jgi:hypothetical protein
MGISDKSVEKIIDGGVAVARLVVGTALGKIAFLCAATGIGIITGTVDAVMKAAWERFLHTPLPLPDTPIWVGCLLLASGIALAVYGHRQSLPKTTTVPRVIAIKHMSMERVAVDLTSDMMPPALVGAAPQTVEIDQTPHYRNGALAIEAAVTAQMDLPTQVAAMAKAMPDATFAYFGKAHIPLAVMAGHSLSTGTKVIFFELGRGSMARWLPLAETVGPNLGIQVTSGEQPQGASDAIVRISVSYPVSLGDIAGSAPGDAKEWHLTIDQPKLDSVTSAAQVAAIAMRFRAILDEVKANHPSVRRIHVFCAAPMSVCFAMGQQITKSIHAAVLVYNFVGGFTPKYPWALAINAHGSGAELIHRVIPVPVPMPA